MNGIKTTLHMHDSFDNYLDSLLEESVVLTDDDYISGSRYKSYDFLLLISTYKEPIQNIQDCLVQRERGNIQYDNFIQKMKDILQQKNMQFYYDFDTFLKEEIIAYGIKEHARQKFKPLYEKYAMFLKSIQKIIYSLNTVKQITNERVVELFMVDDDGGGKPGLSVTEAKLD